MDANAKKHMRRLKMTGTLLTAAELARLEELREQQKSGDEARVQLEIPSPSQPQLPSREE